MYDFLLVYNGNHVSMAHNVYLLWTLDDFPLFSYYLGDKIGPPHPPLCCGNYFSPDWITESLRKRKEPHQKLNVSKHFWDILLTDTYTYTRVHDNHKKGRPGKLAGLKIAYLLPYIRNCTLHIFFREFCDAKCHLVMLNGNYTSCDAKWELHIPTFLQIFFLWNLFFIVGGH